MKTPLQLSYPNGACPDCETPIADSATDGDACENCGHVLWLDEEEVREIYLQEMQDEIRDR